jgi:hypothetical protein
MLEINKGGKAFLLVDSEGPVSGECENGEINNWNPWMHFKCRQGDQWTKPANAEIIECHLMVQCMEAWFLADINALAEYYGQSFNKNPFDKDFRIEKISKHEIFKALEQATRNTANENTVLKLDFDQPVHEKYGCKF